jgi:succinyl-CoA synthetase beta subunit
MRGARLLAGYRGTPALDVDALVDVLVALGCLATELEDVVQSVDINPFVALPQGGLALDALIVLQRQASVEPPTLP